MPFVRRERTYYKHIYEDHTLPTMTSNTAPEGVVESNVSVSGAYAGNPYSLFFNGKANINAYANGSLRYIKYTFKNLLYPDTYTFNYALGINSNVTLYKNQWEVIYEDDTTEEIVNDIDLEIDKTKLFTPTFTAKKCIKAIKLNLHVYAPSDQNCYAEIRSISLTSQGKNTNTVKMVTNAYMVNLGGEDVWEEFKQPVLTSDGVLGGDEFAVRASSQYDSDHTSWFAFDGHDSSEWESSNSVKPPHWIAWYNPNKLKVSKLNFINGNNSYLEKATLQGSNDFSKWDDIQEISNNIGADGEWSVDIYGDDGYLYHRLYITDVSNNSYVDIAKIGITAQELVAVGGNDYDYYINHNKLYQLATVKRSYYKYGTELDATVVGNFARIDKGVASGFSTSNTLNLPKVFNPQSDTWEMFLNFKLTNLSYQYLLGSTGSGDYGTPLAIGIGMYNNANGKLLLSMSSSSSISNDICSTQGKTVLSLNTDYWLKIESTGAAYNVYLSITGEFKGEESLEIAVSSTKSVYQTTMVLGAYRNNSTPFSGSIDLSQSYININGERWWSGDSYTKVGSWIDDGVVGRFSSSNYTRLPFTFEGGSYDNWELVTKIKVNSYSNGPAILCVNSSYGIFNYSVQSSGRVQLALSTNTDSFNICDATGEKVLDLNTWYWYKAEFTGTAYNTYWSADGKVWNLDSSVQKSTKLGNITALNFGIRTKNNDQILDGYIDMQETYFKANGVDVWHGTKAYQINLGGEGVYEDWKQPVLSANGTMGGDSFAVSSSSNYSGWETYKAFDGIYGATGGNGWAASSNSVPQHIIFYSPKKIRVTKLNIINGADGGGFASGVVYGSDDNFNWVEVAPYTNTEFGAATNWDIDLSKNDKAYKYYKLEISSVSGFHSSNIIKSQEITITAQTLKAVGGSIEDADYYTDNIINHSPVTDQTKYYKYWEQPVNPEGITATSGWSNVANAFDDSSDTYATCGTSTDYIEYDFGKEVYVNGITATGNFVSSVSRSMGLRVYSVVDDVETLLGETNKPSDLATYTMSISFAKTLCPKIRIRLAEKNINGDTPTTSYPTRIRNITIQGVLKGTSSDYDYYEHKTKMY